MPNVDFSPAGLAKLRPEQIVDLLDRLDPVRLDSSGLDLDQLGKAIDPRKLSREQFVRLLAALDRLSGHSAAVDLSRMDARTFARLITRASADQLSAIMVRPELRQRVLGEIFRRMSDHLRAERAANTRAVVHWRLIGGQGPGGFDRYETVIENGTCTVNTERTQDARVTITVHPTDFLRLITHNASGPVLFMTGKLRVKGDLGFAAGLTSLFDLPKG